jgi:hypothetical protein
MRRKERRRNNRIEGRERKKGNNEKSKEKMERERKPMKEDKGGQVCIRHLRSKCRENI